MAETRQLPDYLRTGSNDDPNVILGRFIKIGVGLAGMLALLAFMYGALNWIISHGDPKKIEKGQNLMIWSAIGLFVVFSAYILTNYIFKVIQ